MSEEMEKNTTETIGRNEPCPCGSGKKYKRCHGVGAAPKLTAPAVQTGGAPGAGAPGMGPGGFDPASMGIDQAQMMQVAQMMQRLPKGQLQRVQAMMQKAMAGKDVSREAAEFEKTLPVEMQQMLRSMQPNLAAAAAAGGSTPAQAEPEMTEEQARELVAQAMAEGKIDKSEAEKLLEDTGSKQNAETSEEASSSDKKLGRFFKFGKRK